MGARKKAERWREVEIGVLGRPATRGNYTRIVIGGGMHDSAPSLSLGGQCRAERLLLMAAIIDYTIGFVSVLRL